MNNKYFIIQLHAAMTLVGYWCFHAVFSLALGESSRVLSIVYDGIQLLMSLYVIRICKRDILVKGRYSILYFFSLTLVLYAIRMVYDMFCGPFVGKVTTDMFLSDIMLIVFSLFTGSYAIVASRRYINVDAVTRIVFYIGILGIISILLNIIMGASYLSKNSRMDVSQGLGTLQLAKLGAIVIMASIHLIINSGKQTVQKLVYSIGLIMGVWLMLTSGSRGSVVGVVIALGAYLLFSFRRNKFVLILAITIVILIMVMLVPILTWLSDYFPVFSSRMLSTIIDEDQGEREEIFEKAIQFIMDNPIFGYSYRVEGSVTGWGPHNGILEIFLALGIPYGILFVYFQLDVFSHFHLHKFLYLSLHNIKISQYHFHKIAQYIINHK